jgi:hypothetical protein
MNFSLIVVVAASLASSAPSPAQPAHRPVSVSYDLKFARETVQPQRVKQAVEAACALFGLRAVNGDEESVESKMRVTLSGSPRGASYSGVGRRDTGWSTSGSLVIEWGAKKPQIVRRPLSETETPPGEIRVSPGSTGPNGGRPDDGKWLRERWENAGAWLAYRAILGELAKLLGTDPLIQAINLKNPGLHTTWAFDTTVLADVLIAIGDPTYAVALGSALTAKPSRLRAGTGMHSSLRSLTRSKTLGPPWKASIEFSELKDKSAWQLSSGSSNDTALAADILEALMACDVLRRFYGSDRHVLSKEQVNQRLKSACR